MNTKTSGGLLALVILATLFVPLVPNDSLITCTDIIDGCDDAVGYVSIYSKYFSH